MEDINQGDVGNQNQGHPIKSKPYKPGKFIAIAVALIVGWYAVGGLIGILTSPTKLEAAVEACYLDGVPFASIDEDGKGLFLDGQGKKNVGLSVDYTFCTLRELDVPPSVNSRIQNTTSLMGQQEAEWDGITALWTYHPDNGLDISLEIR